MTDPIFGTDGIRGPAYEGWLTLEAVAAIGSAAGSVLAAQGGRALLGHDGRASGPHLERALAAGLRAAGVEAASGGLMTTPGLSWLVRQGEFDLGAMLSASHNPASDNGIKLFSREGSKLSDEVQDAIEERLSAACSHDPGGDPVPIDEALEEAYVAHLMGSVGRTLCLEGLVMVLDCAHGGGSRVVPQVFERLGATVHTLGCSPDGANINEGVGSTHPEALQAAVLRHGATVGVALDGDGDRCILVDERGGLVHGDHIMTVIARSEAARGGHADPRIVATVMSNRGLHRALREVGVSVVEVPVGDRAVVEELRREGLWLGGEQSGHIVFGADNAYIGDGTVTALRVLEVMVDQGQPLSALTAPYVPMPQVLLNVPVTMKPALETLEDVMELTRSVEEELGSDGRVLLRYSGTENLARVMVEGPDETQINSRAEELAVLLRGRLGAES